MTKPNKLMLLLALLALAATAGCSSKQKKEPANPTDVPATQPATEMAEEAASAAPQLPAPPQSGAYGIVADASGQPVAGVSVMIPELNAKHPVNADGTFVIELQPTNKMLTLIFTASGFKPTEKKISAPQGQPAQLSVVLER